MKSYIIFKDGNIGYIKDICTCENCQKRGQAELFINDLDDNYLDCIKANDFEDIVYIGYSLSAGTKDLVKYYDGLLNTKRLELNYLQSTAKFYSNQLIKTN